MSDKRQTWTRASKEQRIEEAEAMYTHAHTGSTASASDWASSYDSEELRERGLTGAQALDADIGITLFAVEA